MLTLSRIRREIPDLADVPDAVLMGFVRAFRHHLRARDRATAARIVHRVYEACNTTH